MVCSISVMEQKLLLLGVHNVIKLLEKVCVQVIVFTGERVEIHHHILLHRDMVHHVDEIQQSLTHKHTHLLSYQSRHIP